MCKSSRKVSKYSIVRHSWGPLFPKAPQTPGQILRCNRISVFFYKSNTCHQTEFHFGLFPSPLHQFITVALTKTNIKPLNSLPQVLELPVKMLLMLCWNNIISHTFWISSGNACMGMWRSIISQNILKELWSKII